MRAHERRIAAARLWATEQLPYLASAVFATPVLLTDGSRTVAADPHWRIQADPELLEQFGVTELGQLVLHLVSHLLRDHADRAQRLGVTDGPAAERWNRAADAEINDDLAPWGLCPAMAPDLPDDLGQPAGQLAETYYQHAQPPRQWDCGSACDGRPRWWDDPAGPGHPPAGPPCLSREQAALLRLTVAAAIHQAAAHLPGTVPGGWLRWAERVLPSRIDWRRLLAAEIRTGIASIAGAVDYTYRRPSRRAHVVPRVVLPSLHRPVPDVAIVCDTSGSMHEQLLGRALGEIEAILSKAGLRHTQVRVLAVDTVVHAVRRVSTASHVQLLGGGGTDMGAGIQAAAELRPRPSMIIVLTDGFTPWPAAPPKGTRVIVGLLAQAVGAASWAPPPWARRVLID